MPKNKTQKIIIPKGTIDPNEDTLIEIPRALQEEAIVVAKGQIYQEKSLTLKSVSKTIENQADYKSQNVDRVQKGIVQDPGTSFNPRYASSFQENGDLYFPPNNIHKSNDAEQRSTSVFNPSQRNLETSFKSTQLTTDLSRSVAVPLSTSSQQSSTMVDNKKGSASENPLLFENSLDDDSLLISTSMKKPKDSTSGSVRFVSTSTAVEAPHLPSEIPQLSVRTDKTLSEVSCQKETCVRASDKQDEDIEVKPIYIRGESPAIDDKKQRSKDSCRKCNRTRRVKEASSDSPQKFEEVQQGNKEELRQFYKCCNNEIDDIYVEQLKRQFEEAKRKLEDAVTLASMSLKRFKSNCDPTCPNSKTKMESIVDSVPERDLSFKPSASSSDTCPILKSTGRSCSKLSTVRTSSDEYQPPERVMKRSLGSPKSTLFDTFSNSSERVPLAMRRLSGSSEPPPSVSPLNEVPDSRTRTSFAVRVVRDTYTQTPTKPSIKEIKIIATSSMEDQPKQDISSRCLVCYSTKNSGSVKAIKEPCCSVSNCESLLEHTSSLMSQQ